MRQRWKFSLLFRCFFFVCTHTKCSLLLKPLTEKKNEGANLKWKVGGETLCGWWWQCGVREKERKNKLIDFFSIKSFFSSLLTACLLSYLSMPSSSLSVRCYLKGKFKRRKNSSYNHLLIYSRCYFSYTFILDCHILCISIMYDVRHRLVGCDQLFSTS